MVPGICSVTYRSLPATDVARLAAAAGLRRIEWGADVHAPVGDHDAVRGVAELTRAYGLEVASYGSYFRARSGEDFGPVLSSAVALGAKRIRIWAGTVCSRDGDIDGVARAVREAAGAAAEHGVELGFEFHHGTLTDTVESTLRLLDRVGRANVTTYWQPPLDVSAEDAVAGLARLGERVCAVHVFSWWPGKSRLPLAERADLWRAVFDTVPRSMDALLEFVPGDDPGVLVREARALVELAT